MPNKPYVEEISFFPSHNPKVLKYFSDINSFNLLPAETALVTGNASADWTSTVKDLNNNIHEQTSALEKLTSINATKSSETKKSFAKLHDCQQKLILAASSVDGLQSADSATDFENFISKYQRKIQSCTYKTPSAQPSSATFTSL